MGLTLKGELRRTFEKATLREEARTLQNARQWKQVDDLMARAKALRDREDRLYAERYAGRIEVARRRLMHEAAAPTRSLQPGWIGYDRFDQTDLNRQAERAVRADHHRRIGRIVEAEARAMTEIVRQAGWQNALQGRARDAFTRAAGPSPPSGPGGNSGPTRD